MSTTKWLLDNDSVQRCADCDFYPCSNTREDVFASNDCDMFTHEDEEEMLDEDDLPETWQEFLDNFGIIMLAGGEANLVVPKGRVKQMMELYHDPVVRDLDKFIQACEELHDIPAEDEILRLEKENAKLREQSERLFDKTLEVATENAKLRELVREMSFPYKYGDLDCGLCPHVDKCWDSETLEFSPDGCAILQMVRELGIEVE